MKLFITLTLFIFFTQSAISQVVGGTNQKLAGLYKAGKYETCLFRADSYTYKEDYKRDPEPYLYISMSFYGLSQSEDEEIQDDYKDAMRQAIKTGAKFVRKDKEGQMYADNIDYINTLKDEQYKIVNQAYKDKKYSRVATNAKTYNRLNKEPDQLLNYFVGINQMLSNNTSTGSRTIETATEKLNEQFKVGVVKSDARFTNLISKAFADYTDYLVKGKELTLANETAAFGLKVFPNDGYLKVLNNMISKSIENEEKERAEAVKQARENLNK